MKEYSQKVINQRDSVRVKQGYDTVLTINNKIVSENIVFGPARFQLWLEKTLMPIQKSWVVSNNSLLKVLLY